MAKDKLIELPYGLTSVQCEVPRKFLTGIYSPKPKLARIEKLKYKLSKILDNSIGIPANSLLNVGEKVAIAITDRTRSTPNSRILPILLDKLNILGKKDNDITVIIAGGLHTSDNELDIKANVGRKVLRRVHVISHSPYENLKRLGTTSFGTPIYINNEFAKADVKITTGNIVPCNLAGWSGGSKTVLPGVSGEGTIRRNHKLFLHMIRSLKRCSAVGVIHNNIVRADMEECGRIVGHSLVINTILSPKNEIIDIVVGDPVEAHRKGVEIAYDSLSQRIPSDADMVLASTGNYSFETSLYQGVSRSLQALDCIIKPGGCIVVLCECREGIGEGEEEDTFKEWLVKLPTPSKLLKLAEQDKIPMENCPPLYIISWFVHNLRTNLVIASNSLNEGNLGCMEIIKLDNLQETIDKILMKRYKQNPKVVVIPHASITLPIAS